MCWMEQDLAFRSDLYRGTAPYYDRYRPPYPEALFEDLRQGLPVSGQGRLLDLACGTGQIAFPLAGDFAEVVAVDQEPESVAFGRDKAEAAGITNIRWITGAASSVDIDGPFELVAIGTAFHRLDRTRVARRMLDWLQPGGGVALLWAVTPPQGERPWQKALEALFEEWMAKIGTTDRVPAGWDLAMTSLPHAEVLRQAGLDYIGEFKYTNDHVWTVESLIGFAYSTSLLNRHALGDEAAAFEAEMAQRLSPLGTDGRFVQRIGYAYELARKPQSAKIPPSEATSQ
jgi:SAM-dependent methyltransferase